MLQEYVLPVLRVSKTRPGQVQKKKLLLNEDRLLISIISVARAQCAEWVIYENLLAMYGNLLWWNVQETSIIIGKT